MTKKTSSLLLRYGITSLWYNKSINRSDSLNILRLENIVYTEFKKKNVSVFRVHYVRNTLTVLVYNRCSFLINQRRRIVQYYSKVLDLGMVVQKFGLCEQHIVNFLRSVGIRRIKMNINNNKSIYRVFLEYVVKKKRYLSLLNMKLRLWSSVTDFMKQVLSHSLCGLININSYYFMKNSMKKTNFFFLRLRETSGSVQFKIFSIQMENKIFWLLSKTYSISVSSIWLRGGYLMKMWQDSKFKREQFRFVFYTVILSATYVNSRLLADYISYVLLGNKNHFKSLRVVTDVLSFYFLRNTLPLKGIRMWVTGKLGGKMRKSKYSFKVGKVQLQTLKNALSYNMALSFTKFGVISVKVWLIKNAKNYL